MNILAALLIGLIIGTSFLLVIILISESNKHKKNKKVFIHYVDPRATIQIL